MNSSRNGMLGAGMLAVVLGAAGVASTALADDGHGHGDAHADAPAAQAAPALPRFQAASNAFELVGVVDGRKLRVWLDRFDDNAPVRGAEVELDVGGTKVALHEQAEGEFEGVLASAPATGVTPITATVTAGTRVDALASELDVHAETAPAPATGWDRTRIAGWIAAGLLGSTLLACVGRRVVAHRRGEGTA